MMTLTFFVLTVWMPTTSLNAAGTRQVSVAEKYNRLNATGRERMIAKLVDAKNYGAILALCKARCADIDMAAFELIKQSDTRRVIQTIRQIPTDTWNWEFAFAALQFHERKVVIPYVREICKNGNPRLKAACYRLCSKNNWIDLVDFAMLDLTSNEIFAPINGDSCISVSAMGRDYLVHSFATTLARIALSGGLSPSYRGR